MRTSNSREEEDDAMFGIEIVHNGEDEMRIEVSCLALD